ncbi:hypothetical protein [Rhodopila sp.]|uniref:hypothetical protein n=1 Tax=Rhodopila sp. TaxID=2480087 RepID=UPI003D0B32B7
MVDPPTWWPRCHACRQPIERLEWTFDPAVPKLVRFQADCHGMAIAVVVTRARAMAGPVPVDVPVGPGMMLETADV